MAAFRFSMAVSFGSDGQQLDTVDLIRAMQKTCDARLAGDDSRGEPLDPEARRLVAALDASPRRSTASNPMSGENVSKRPAAGSRSSSSKVLVGSPKHPVTSSRARSRS